MGVEIERKFLVSGDAWRSAAKTSDRVKQGYLVNEPERAVRVRVRAGRGYLTIKGAARGIARAEFEYEIPGDEAESMIAMFCGATVIDKTRWIVPHAGHEWEVDEFHGANAGLVVAELELKSEGEAFTRPPWLGDEVSDDPRYLNARLIQHPYSRWQR